MDDEHLEGDELEEFQNDEFDEDLDSDGAESLIEDGEEDSETSRITFDITLPSSHSYLWDGSECQEISGRTIHEDGTELCLPVLSLPGVVLMPGQVLPLHLFQNQDIAMIKHCLDKDRTFGHVTKIIDPLNDHAFKLGRVGTTAEILAVKEVHMSYRVKTIGRQRFKILETRSDIGGVLIARVRILPEKKLINLLTEICPNSYRKHMDRNRNFETTDICRKKPKFCPSIMTFWPIWVYDQFNCDLLMDKIRMELTNWSDSFDLSKVPSDPCMFSYWVASALPLDDTMRLEILGKPCTEQRLKCELDLMKKCTVMCCKHCKQPIAEKRDVFSMSTDGPLGTYVNPGGHVHETLTVHHVTGLSLHGRPSTQSSWFPGYAWTIVLCQVCKDHIGWKFTRVGRNSNLKPEKFWGLCRSSLVPVLNNELSDQIAM